mmetsp:Transcript_21707/g.32320  ORF Transcript_21707/g.32320 Transcript_21707/m.32320 type:complete len:378 (+) Transcript_21707:2708-3841(+)
MSAAPANANEGCVGPDSKLAGKASACAGCPNQKRCASGKGAVDPAAEKVRDSFGNVKHTILVLSGKGGVGKSTIASQLAWSLADMTHEVGVLDIDICGPSMPRMLGVENEQVHQSGSGWSPVMAEDNLAVMSVGFMLRNKTDAVIWRGPRKTGLIRQFLTDVDWGKLDYLIVDAPPGTSDEHISIAKLLQKVKIDGAVIVTTPQEVALLDVRKEISFCKKTGIPIIGVIENMSKFSCPMCGYDTKVFPPVSGGAKKMCMDMGVPYLGDVPMDSKLLESCEKGVSFTAAYPKSLASKHILRIVNMLKGKNLSIEPSENKQKMEVEVDEQEIKNAKMAVENILEEMKVLAGLPKKVLQDEKLGLQKVTARLIELLASAK